MECRLLTVARVPSVRQQPRPSAAHPAEPFTALQAQRLRVYAQQGLTPEYVLLSHVSIVSPSQEAEPGQQMAVSLACIRFATGNQQSWRGGFLALVRHAHVLGTEMWLWK